MRLFLNLTFIFLSLQAFSEDTQFEWQTRHIRDNLYQLRSDEIRLKEDFNKLNEQAILELQSFSPQSSEGRVTGINYAQGLQVMNNLIQSPLFKNQNKDYDFRNNLGLCFGRATFLHLELLRHGVNKDSIKKIFVIGPMATSDIVWQFHVATIVKDVTTNQWWVLDTNLRKPVPIQEWISVHKKYAGDVKKRFFFWSTVDRTKSLRFYISEPQKIGPSSWEYNTLDGGLFHDSYNNYFKDMFAYFKSRPVTKANKFNANQCRNLF